MEKDLTPNTFNFFKNTKEAKAESLGFYGFVVSMLPLWGLMIIILIASIFINANFFDDTLSKYISHQKASSSIVAKRMNYLNVSLNKKDWANVQYNLLILRKLDSTATDKEVLTVLANYSKQQPYSNEFSLLTTNYLISMQNEPTEDKIRMKIMDKEIDSVLIKNIINGEESFKQESVVYNSSINEIKEKANYLIKNLKESPLKESLFDSFNH